MSLLLEYPTVLNIAYKALMTWSLPPKQTHKIYSMSDGDKFHGDTTKAEQGMGQFWGQGLLFK